MSRILREQEALFLNIVPLTPDYARVNKGVASAVPALNPAKTTEQYIGDSASTTTLDGYAPSIPVTIKAIDDDEVFVFVNNLSVTQAVGTDAETDYVMVHLHETPTLTVYPATKQLCTVSVDNALGGDGGAQAELSFTLDAIGDPIQGTFDTADNSFTPTP